MHNLSIFIRSQSASYWYRNNIFIKKIFTGAESKRLRWRRGGADDGARVPFSDKRKDKLTKGKPLLATEVANCNFAVNQSRRPRRDSASKSTRQKHVTADRTTCYADAQWHNLRAVVPAIKVGF